MNRIRRYLEDRRLRTKTSENTSLFTFDGTTIRAKCIDVYDGDTITVIFKLYGSKYYQFKIRLYGIDTPEIRTRDADEKTRGLQARDYVRSKILDTIITLERKGFDKYGRILGIVWYNGTCLNRELCKLGLAKIYIV